MQRMERDIRRAFLRIMRQCHGLFLRVGKVIAECLPYTITLQVFRYRMRNPRIDDFHETMELFPCTFNVKMVGPDRKVLTNYFKNLDLEAKEVITFYAEEFCKKEYTTQIMDYLYISTTCLAQSTTPVLPSTVYFTRALDRAKALAAESVLTPLQRAEKEGEEDDDDGEDASGREKAADAVDWCDITQNVFEHRCRKELNLKDAYIYSLSIDMDTHTMELEFAREYMNRIRMKKLDKDPRISIQVDIPLVPELRVDPTATDSEKERLVDQQFDNTTAALETYIKTIKERILKKQEIQTAPANNTKRAGGGSRRRH